MKARVLTDTNAIRKEVERQFSEKKFEVMQEIAPDVAQQVLSNVLITLEKSYGFKKRRLQSFLEQLKAMCELMDNPTHLTHRFDTDDNIAYLKDKYGIDLRTEFTFDVVSEFER